jgi:hypothetical protein
VRKLFFLCALLLAPAPVAFGQVGRVDFQTAMEHGFLNSMILDLTINTPPAQADPARVPTLYVDQASCTDDQSQGQLLPPPRTNDVYTFGDSMEVPGLNGFGFLLDVATRNAPGGTATLRIPVNAANGSCEVELTLQPSLMVGPMYAISGVITMIVVEPGIFADEDKVSIRAVWPFVGMYLGGTGTYTFTSSKVYLPSGSVVAVSATGFVFGSRAAAGVPVLVEIVEIP